MGIEEIEQAFKDLEATEKRHKEFRERMAILKEVVAELDKPKESTDAEGGNK